MQATSVVVQDTSELNSEKQPPGECLQAYSSTSCLTQEICALEENDAGASIIPRRGSMHLADSIHEANNFTTLLAPSNAFSSGPLDAAENANVLSHPSSMTPSSTPRETGYEYVFGVVNPSSGETGIVQYVLRSMRELLGANRVMTLDAPLFANPAPLVEAIRNYAVHFGCQGSNSTVIRGGIEGSKNAAAAAAAACSGGCGTELERRGTVIVCGGDGTVAFVMEQLDAVYEMIKSATMASSGTGMGHLKRRVLLPAVAVLALGTGNDYSNCMGFGSGYLHHKLSGLCCCMENTIEPLVRHAVTAPAIPFDRWTARLVPLTAIWEQQQKQQQRRQTLQKSGTEKTGAYLSVNTRRGDTMAEAEKNKGGRHEEQEAVTADIVDLRALDWDALDAAGACMKYNFINYFSIGFDAYVVQKFDAFRRKHLKFCSTRMHNKLVYATYSLKAQFRCSSLRSSISNVCIPQLTGCVSSHTDGSQRPDEQIQGNTSIVTISLPKSSKTLLVTNVSSYAAGTRPWREEKGHLYRDDHATNSMVITPVCVNDRLMEVQAVGGLFQMGLLQMGIGQGASKLAQTRELFLFVLCKSTDIARSPTSLKSVETTPGRVGDEEHTPLCMQIDGEAIGRITHPTVVYITELHKPRVYVRCRNPSVVRHHVQDEDLVI
ncbi:putative diacylglycerol kinase [Trypanosoma rangeli]|uniref:diacylglycerol kinase (ATP) n=1 Tax=Trypanosoma rangeli TaxID=5698 RepID=A0A3R7MJ80_TRYRA|nr:putative diacylglycerol kinase [Trypanosoma rangeli]RNF03479.1 putative diacylglycerol kinase [Trypanosoma rangeli]|eukprot:RNF03479.1 putative diacylglycerol kinase [Trypanosoma rangeli]